MVFRVGTQQTGISETGSPLHLSQRQIRTLTENLPSNYSNVQSSSGMCMLTTSAPCRALTAADKPPTMQQEQELLLNQRQQAVFQLPLEPGGASGCFPARTKNECRRKSESKHLCDH